MPSGLWLRLFLGVSVIWWLSFLQCYAVNGVLSWKFENGGNTLGPDQLMECETLSISLSPKTSNPSGGKMSFFILAVEPRGNATMSIVGHQPPSLQWTIEHPAGTQLYVVLLDTLGTSFGVLPLVAMYTVIRFKDSVAKSHSPGALDVTQPKTSSSTFGHLILCSFWVHFVSGGEPIHSISIVILGSENVYSCSVPPGEHIHSFTNGGEPPTQAIVSPCSVVIVNDVNGMRDAMSSISDIVGAADTPSSGTPATLSSCRPAQLNDLPSYSRQPPRPTAFRFHRSLPDHPHMQLSRDMATINSSAADTVAVAVCVSLGGTGLVAVIIYAIMKYRLRQKHQDAQDTLPRPFEIIVPAANTALITHDLTSVPVLDISSRALSRSEGGGGSEIRRKEVPARIEPLRAGSVLAPTLTTTTPSRSQSSLSRNTRTRPSLSDATVVSNHAGPSFHPPHSFRSHELPDRQSHPGSRVQSVQSPSSLPTQPRRAAGPSRSATVQERRSAKRALWLSRSASELYRASSSVPHYRTPESGPHESSGRYTRRLDERELHVDTFVHATNHLRQWHSASPIVRAEDVHPDPAEDLGRTVVFQHQDAGVMQELPPPYHKLVRPVVEV